MLALDGHETCLHSLREMIDAVFALDGQVTIRSRLSDIDIVLGVTIGDVGSVS